MRYAYIPAAATVALLTFCSPRSNAGDSAAAGAPETGMASSDTASTGTPAADAAPMTPNGMLSQIDLANTAEIDLGKKAQTAGSSPQVKRIAKKLQTDHAKNHQELQALARKLNVDIVPATTGAINPDSGTMPADLTNKRGAEFDRAYVAHEIQDHQSNIDKIQNTMIPAASNTQVKAFLQKTLTAMQGHMTELEQIQKGLSS